MQCIYMIKNKINNKVYIGQSVNNKTRNYNHLRSLRSNKHVNILLQRAFNKYGEENFEFNIVIERIDDEEKLSEREEYWINYYDSMNSEKGYNLRGAGVHGKFTDILREKISGPNNGMYGKKHSEESRKKISLSKKGQVSPNKGKKFDENFKAKMSEIKKGQTPWNKGKTDIYSEETKTKMSNSKKGKPSLNKGRKMSNEQKEQISKTKKSKEYTRNPASKLSNEDVFTIIERINNGDMVKDIAKDYGVNRRTISLIKNGKSYLKLIKTR